MGNEGLFRAMAQGELGAPGYMLLDFRGSPHQGGLTARCRGTTSPGSAVSPHVGIGGAGRDWLRRCHGRRTAVDWYRARSSNSAPVYPTSIEDAATWPWR